MTAPSTNWFLAEGATGAFFELFVLIANPNPTGANVTVDYLLTNGSVLTKTYTVAANSRFTIWVDEEQFPNLSGNRALASVSCSMRVRSTNGVPIIVERAMWWPQPNWYEAHNAPGTTVTGTRWALAGGEVGGAEQPADVRAGRQHVGHRRPGAGDDLLRGRHQRRSRRSTCWPTAGPMSRLRDTFPSSNGRRFGDHRRQPRRRRRPSWSSSARCTRTPAA